MDLCSPSTDGFEVLDLPRIPVPGAQGPTHQVVKPFDNLVWRRQRSGGGLQRTDGAKAKAQLRRTGRDQVGPESELSNRLTTRPTNQTDQDQLANGHCLSGPSVHLAHEDLAHLRWLLQSVHHYLGITQSGHKPQGCLS